MSSFWDGMERGNAAAVGAMGEDVRFDGELFQGVVDDLEYEDTASAGGKRAVVTARILVGAEVPLRDGMPVEVRGVAGKVVSWKPIGPDGHRSVQIGPFNRWSGDVPGL